VDDACVVVSSSKDRLRDLIDAVVASIDEPAASEQLAKRMFLSRFHFDRLVAAALGESPARFRRRLLLERAAFELRSSSVIDVAIAAGYGSAEAFSRAFRRSFGVSPREHRGDFRLEAPNHIHFHPPGGMVVPGDDRRRGAMDLTDRLVEHDIWSNTQLIELAKAIPPGALDEPVEINPADGAWFEDRPSIRSMLDRLVFTKEMWSAAIAGTEPPSDQRDASLDALARRLDDAGKRFTELVRGIRDRGAWDTAFVDATCDPPESFTFGGAISHALIRDSYRRQVLIGVLTRHGLDTSGLADPMHFGQS
jgi:AraC-like DNA-binding protein